MKAIIKRGTVLPKGDVVAEVKCITNEYAIVRTDVKSYGLFLTQKLFDNLKNYVLQEFLENKFVAYEDGYYFSGKQGNSIFGARLGPFADYYLEIMDFCEAVGKYYKTHKKKFLNDIIYIEEFDFLLPLNYDEKSANTVEKLIGSWLSDGILVLANDVNKVEILNQWLSKEEIIRAVTIAGINDIFDSTNGSELTKVDVDKCSNKDIKESSRQNVGNIEVIKTKEPFVLPGREYLTKYFNEEIIDFFCHQEKYEKLGINSVPATLLYGKPGCGKTYAIEQLAKYLEFPVFEINSATVASPYIHDTSKKIGEIFEKAIQAAPSILILDELESYVSARGNDTSHSHHIEEVDEFLRNIPRAIDAKVIIFAMTNLVDIIDPAILRKGRFDNQIEVGMPSQQEVEAVLKCNLSKTQVSGEINVSELASKLLDRPLSDVAYVVRQAIRLTVRAGKESVENADLFAALAYLGSQEQAKEKKRRPIGFITDDKERKQ